MSSGNHRIVDLLQLQNLTKRDPAAYKEEFLLQHQHFLTQLQIFQLKPTKDFKPFAQLVSYLSHVCSLYPKEMADFPKQIADLLENNCNNLEPDLRRILAKSLILMRNRNMMQQIPLLTLFFKLFRVHDKPLRKLLYSYIVTDIKNTNLKHKNVKLNKTLQNFMFTMMNDSSEVATLMSLKVMIELFRKKIWHDIKTVNVIKNGVFSKNSKIVTTSLNFFLHVDNPDKEDDSDREDAKRQEEAKQEMRKASLASRVAKKTKARTKRAEKAKVDYKKIMEANDKKTDPNFPAIELIHDPQTFSEKLYSVLRRTTERFETRLLMMNFISRLIHVHKLLVYNFYPFLQKYIQPNQKNITYILAVLAQSCHDLVDPDVIKPVIRSIATYFVNDGCNPEVIAIGLNTIRNICQRCPLAMDPVLLHDLVMYKNKKEKGVMMAGRSLLQFFRDYYPSMLKKKDRGNRTTDKAPLQYGQTVVSTGVDGMELLYDEELRQKFEAYQNGEFDLSDEDEDDEDDSGEWEDVEEVEDEDDDGEWVTDDDEEEEDEEIEGEDDGEEWVTDDEEDEEDEDDEGEWKNVDDDDEVPTLVKNGEKAPPMQLKKKSTESKKINKKQQAEEEEEEEEDDDSGEWIDVDDELLDELNNCEWEEVDSDEEDEDDEDEDDEEEEENEKPGKFVKRPAGLVYDGEDSEEEEEESFENENEAVENELKQLEKEKKEKPKKKEDDDDLGIKILSDEDLHLIRQLKLFKEALENKSKRKLLEEGEDDSEEEENELGYIDATDLQGSHKRKRATKEERIKTVLEGREGREEYKSKKARKDTYGKSIRNELKAKLTKPFLLTKQSSTVRAKQFMSLRDKQMAKQTHIIGQKNYSR